MDLEDLFEQKRRRRHDRGHHDDYYDREHEEHHDREHEGRDPGGRGRGRRGYGELRRRHHGDDEGMFGLNDFGLRAFRTPSRLILAGILLVAVAGIVAALVLPRLGSLIDGATWQSVMDAAGSTMGGKK